MNFCMPNTILLKKVNKNGKIFNNCEEVKRLTKDELYIVNNISKAISREQQRLNQLNDWIQRITIELDGLPHNNSCKSNIDELTSQIVDCENYIAQLKLSLADNRAKLITTIDNSISEGAQKSVLVERYGFGESFKKIAEKMYISERNVFRLHRKGLKILTVSCQLQGSK